MSEERLMKILLAPHVSEKSSMVEQYGQYVFKVLQDATKPEIRKAVELMFNVKVLAVCTNCVKPKRKVFRQKEGHRKGWKKAFIKLEQGFQINLGGAA